MASRTGHRRSGIIGERGTVDAEISRAIARIYTEFCGRAPAEARTCRQDELVICLLEDIFSTPERVLVEVGQFEQVRLNWQAIRDEIAPRIRSAVEDVTGRQAVVCTGQVIESGLACEICLLGGAYIPAGLQDPAFEGSPRRG